MECVPVNNSIAASVCQDSKPICREYLEEGSSLLSRGQQTWVICVINMGQKRAAYFTKSKRAVCKLIAE